MSDGGNIDHFDHGWAYVPIDNTAMNSRCGKVRIMNLKRGSGSLCWKIWNCPLEALGVSKKITALSRNVSDELD
jgi:hypothetical protein